MNELTPQDMPPPTPAPEDVPQPPQHDAPAHARKKKAKRRFVAIVLVAVTAVIALWYFQKNLALPLERLVSFENSIGTTIGNRLEESASSSWPQPLKQATRTTLKKANTLTIAGVIEQTNIQRAQNGGLPPLEENATLDAVATLRIDDMFARQYFAHVGPDGESAVTVASSVGYRSLALGENLALGLYAGDTGVVNAWMESPGHRANILDTQYTQIGVAVRMGTFEGQQTWIAVQVFGRPASDCPAPDANLKTSIDLSEKQISAMATELTSDKAAIDAMNPQSGPQYNAQVQDYNNLAAQYNNLVDQTKTAIATYDAEVGVFNDCLQK